MGNMGLFLFGNFRAKMARNTKVQKIGDAKLNECEQAIGFALMELESNSDLKAQLRELFIRSAQEIEIGKGKKAIVIFVPVPSSRPSRRSRSDWCVSLRRSSPASTSSSLPSARSWPSPQGRPTS